MGETSRRRSMLKRGGPQKSTSVTFSRPHEWSSWASMRPFLPGQDSSGCVTVLKMARGTREVSESSSSESSSSWLCEAECSSATVAFPEWSRASVWRMEKNGATPVPPASINILQDDDDDDDDRQPERSKLPL